MSDLISRQAAIDGFYEMAIDTDHLCTVSDYVHFLETMNSAEPKVSGHYDNWKDLAYDLTIDNDNLRREVKMLRDEVAKLLGGKHE